MRRTAGAGQQRCCGQYDGDLLSLASQHVYSPYCLMSGQKMKVTSVRNCQVPVPAGRSAL